MNRKHYWFLVEWRFRDSIEYHFYCSGLKKASDDEEGVEEKPETPVQKKVIKKATDRWAHDFFDESEQAPKSRAELVHSYGYDIRNEDGPPKARRPRRYK